MLMLRGFLVLLLLGAPLACPEEIVEKNIFSDSVYQFFKNSKKQADLVFVDPKTQNKMEEIVFFKRSFRAKTLLKKIKEKPILDFSGISGGIFLEKTDGALEVKLLGVSEDGYLETASASPNQVVVVAADALVVSRFFGDDEGDSFFDPVIRDLQDSPILEKFPQLSEEKIFFQDFKSLDLANMDNMKITAEGVCLRYLKNNQ